MLAYHSGSASNTLLLVCIRKYWSDRLPLDGAQAGADIGDLGLLRQPVPAAAQGASILAALAQSATTSCKVCSDAACSVVQLNQMLCAQCHQAVEWQRCSLICWLASSVPDGQVLCDTLRTYAPS